MNGDRKCAEGHLDTLKHSVAPGVNITGFVLASTVVDSHATNATSFRASGSTMARPSAYRVGSCNESVLPRFLVRTILGCYTGIQPTAPYRS